jgi:HEAT repeat protein
MVRVLVLTAATALAAPPGGGASAAAQEPKPGEVTAGQVKGAIDQLGVLDFPVRMKAAQTVRRASAPIAVSALMEAVSSHADGYVRFKAAVLLAGFNDPRAKSLMLQALTDPNDRLRAAAYAYFEHHPSLDALSVMVPALKREESEFVRPALTRALAAASVASFDSGGARKPTESGLTGPLHHSMRDAVTRGQDFFRSVVIEALGDYRARYAMAEISKVALLDGPLQDDAALALGKIGEKRALETLAAIQRTAPREIQPTIAAAICLLGVNCSSHVGYLIETLRFSVKNLGYQGLLRSAAAGLGAVAATGNGEALAALVETGAPSRDPARAPIALAIGTAALRNPPFLLRWLEARPDVRDVAALIGEAFDMLEEDFEEERFFVAARRAYWAAADGSPTRKVAAALIGILEF